MVIRKNYADYKKDNTVVVKKRKDDDFTKCEKMAFLCGIIVGALCVVIIMLQRKSDTIKRYQLFKRWRK